MQPTQLSKNYCGLMFGVLMAAIHLLWSLLVLADLAKPLLDWILSLHFMSFTYSMLEFNYLSALLLLVVTFVVGYVVGFVVAAILNKVKA
ncbi:MAG: hypothetical protein WC806_03835 [Candidatus Gracilibacteria bacterium]|jgi:hypothetical protein